MLARLARLTAFSAGRELALALRPSPEYAVVVERQRLLAEAVGLSAGRTPFDLGSAADVRPAVEKAALGGVLEARELAAVAATQRIAEQALATLARFETSWPLLAERALAIGEEPALVAEIGRAIDGRGDVLDGASPALGLIRRDIKISHDRLHAKLQEFIASAAGRQAAQESIVTLRDGRYVVPIKADFRGEVRGIVHDVSSSGATLFIEPLAVVDLANRWRELQIEERHEVERVLRSLSALVGTAAAAIDGNVAVLAELDLLLASARLGEELSPGGRGFLPEAAAGDPEEWLARPPAALELRDARHPLLTTPVPVTLRVGDDERVLLITGPNTGGKTVALKMTGLLALMAQAGLPVPAAPGSRLPVFGEVLADIGDEQSLEQSLSTFSGHLRNIIDLLERTRPDSLVLLDELAAGTDPAEGAALARALLEQLLAKGALTVATTHHGELKLFAHSTAGIGNAAVEFDSETLAPTFGITLGLPGRSNALAIAARLGLPESVLAAARASLAPDQVAIDSLLDELRQEREAATVARRAEEQAQRQAEAAKARLEERLAAIDAERAERLDEAAIALEVEVAAAREALARVERLSRREPAPSTAAMALEEAGEAASELSEAREAVGEAATAARRLRRRSRRRRSGGLDLGLVLPGAAVWIQGIPLAAEVLSAPDRRGEINVGFGGLRARVRLDQVMRVEKASTAPLPQRATLPEAPAATTEIEVRGQTLDEALPKVEKFLDDGFRAGLPRLRVIHGKGTGKLRQAVREMLTRHPLVKAFDFAIPPEGGEGVTVVEVALG